jgi:hypothetical protein
MNWLSGLFRKRKREKELEEEMQSHLKLSAEARVERGAEAREAEHAARREFGNVGMVKEVTRDVWGWRWLRDVVDDVRYGWRMLGKNPGFAIVAILSLALGIGATTAVFSVVYGVLVNPYPYVNSDRMVHLLIRDAGGNRRYVNLTGPQLQQLRQASCVESSAAMEAWELMLCISLPMLSSILEFRRCLAADCCRRMHPRAAIPRTWRCWVINSGRDTMAAIPTLSAKLSS